MEQYLQRCLNLRDDSYLEIECRLKDRENNWHWIQTRKTIFSRTKEQQSQQILTIASDITNRKETYIVSRHNYRILTRLIQIWNKITYKCYWWYDS